MGVSPRQYYVEWRIDVWASSPEEAARKALDLQRHPGSLATVFHVATDDGFVVVDVDPDLNEPKLWTETTA